MLTARPFPEQFGRLPGGRTYAMAMKLEAGFDQVRLVYGNDRAEPYDVTAAAIAAAAAPGREEGWTAVTFGGAAALTVPGAASPEVPAFACSDWMALTAVPPAEADGLPWLMTRSYFAAEGRCVQVGGDTLGRFNTPEQGRGRAVLAWHRDGDWVHAGGPLPGATGYGFIAPVAVQYRSLAAGLTVMCVGDSITRGRGTASHFAPWGLRAVTALSHPGRPLSFVNAGVDGARTSVFHAAARGFLTLGWPDVMVIAPYSPNDTYDHDGPPLPWREGLGRALALATEAAEHGCLPVLTTPLPVFGLSAAQAEERSAVIAALRGLATRGVPVWDLAATVGDGGSPALLRPEFSADGIHPNDAGHARMAGAAIAGLAPLLRRFGGEKRYRDDSGVGTGPAGGRNDIEAGAGTTAPASMEQDVSSPDGPITDLDIAFAVNGNGETYTRGGWAQPERHGRWSAGKESVVVVDGLAPGDYQVTINLGPFLLPPLIMQQNLQIIVNGRLVWADYLRENRLIQFALPGDLFAGGGTLDFRFVCPTARSPKSVSDSVDVRVLGFTIWNLRLTRSGGAPAAVVAAPAVTLAASAPKVAAVTMVYNESVYLPIWLRHYAAQVGIENCFIIDHGSEDGSTDGLKGCNVIRIPRSPYDPHKQSAFNSLFCSSMTKWYDRVIYSDVDEILLADPKIAPTLAEYCRRPLPEVVTAIGLNTIHLPDSEPEFDPSRPVSSQRPYVFLASSMCKPLLISGPIEWSPGSHSSGAPTVFDHLYMFHLRWFDLPYGLRRLRKTREMAWASLEAGGHQRFEDEKFIATHMGFARLPRKDGLEFDPSVDPVHAFTQQVLASRPEREDKLYKIDLGIWPRELWRLPERFIGTF